MEIELVRDSGKIKLFINGELWRTLAPGPFGPLLRGVSSAKELQERLAQEEPKLALRVAVQLLAKQQLTSKQLQERLARRGFLAEIAKKTAQRCSDEGWVDDSAWTRGYITARYNKGYGKRRIELELRQRGLEWPTGLPSRDKEVLEKLMSRRYANIKDAKARRKALTSLCSRGFSFEEILSLWPS